MTKVNKDHKPVGITFKDLLSNEEIAKLYEIGKQGKKNNPRKK